MSLIVYKVFWGHESTVSWCTFVTFFESELNRMVQKGGMQQKSLLKIYNLEKKKKKRLGKHTKALHHTEKKKKKIYWNNKKSLKLTFYV